MATRCDTTCTPLSLDDEKRGILRGRKRIKWLSSWRISQPMAVVSDSKWTQRETRHHVTSQHTHLSGDTAPDDLTASLAIYRMFVAFCDLNGVHEAAWLFSKRTPDAKVHMCFGSVGAFDFTEKSPFSSDSSNVLAGNTEAVVHVTVITRTTISQLHRYKQNPVDKGIS